MSIVTLILGQSGTGKSTSMKFLDPANTLLIKALNKPLPFKPNWKTIEEGGNVIVSDKSDRIIYSMNKTQRNIIVLDDFQYTMANEFMRRVTDQEVGNTAFQKYNEIAKSAWDILNCAANLPDNKRVYILSHTQTDDNGNTKIKTIGKLLDEKITIEGMVSIVLRSMRVNGNYLFATQNNGNDTTKTPMGMFKDEFIENDLNAVDKVICEYYQLKQAA